VEEERVMNQRELALAGLALEEGRALVICANKLDALTPEDQHTFVDTLTGLIQERFLDAGRLPVVGLSALTGKGLDHLLPVVQQAFESWNKRVNTGKINRMLEQLRAERTQTSSKDVIARIKYMCQIKARPPSFVAFLSGSSPVPESGIKHLAQSIRERLGFDGIPVRLWMRPAEARSLLSRTKTARAGRPMGMRGGMATRQRRKKALNLSMSKVRDQAATKGEKEPKKVPFKLRVKLLLQENKQRTS
jgi:predicted GTPase